MKKYVIDGNVDSACDRILALLAEKNFTVFADIDHRANAASVGLEMPSARTLIFGNPQAGTKLMQRDITASFDLPLRLAVAESDGKTLVLHPAGSDFEAHYDLRGHPVLEAVDELFADLLSRLTTDTE